MSDKTSLQLSPLMVVPVGQSKLERSILSEQEEKLVLFIANIVVNKIEPIYDQEKRDPISAIQQ